jgi:hypothetical protein
MGWAARSSAAASIVAAQRRIPKALDWIANRTGTGMAAGLFTQAANASNKARGINQSYGGFNAFQRLSDLFLGKAAPVPGAPPLGKLPALPARPLSIPPTTGNATAETARKAGEDFFAFLKHRAGVAGVVGGAFANAIRQDLRQIPGSLPAALRQERPAARVGISGAEFGRQLQADILDNKKFDEQIRETRNLGVILGEIRDLTRRGLGQVGNALLGPE